MPAPDGNANAYRHGGRTERFGLAHARLGRKFATAYHDLNRLRAAVEGLLRQAHGELTVCQVGRIQTLIRLEESCRACELLIRQNPDMPANELRQHRESIVRWSLQRDKLLGELLGAVASEANPGDPWAVVDQAAAQAVRLPQDRREGPDPASDPRQAAEPTDTPTGDDAGRAEPGAAE